MGKPKSVAEQSLGNIGGRSLSTINRIHTHLSPNQRSLFLTNFIRSLNMGASSSVSSSSSSSSSEVGIYCNGETYYMSTQEYASLSAQCGGDLTCICDTYLS